MTVTIPGLIDEARSTQSGTEKLLERAQAITAVQLAEPSLLPGWSRAHVLAHLDANARAVGRLVARAAGTGTETMYPSAQARAEEIESLARGDADVLCTGLADSAAALQRAWAELPVRAWAERVSTASPGKPGGSIPVTETVWLRGREVWIHLVDLNVGFGFEAIPARVLNRFLDDAVRSWIRRGETGIRLESLEDGQRRGPETAETLLRAPLSALVAWASGRDDSGVRERNDGVPAAPPWSF